MSGVQSFVLKIRRGREAVNQAEDAICRAYYEQALLFKSASQSGFFDPKMSASLLNQANVYLNRLKMLSDMREAEIKQEKK